MAFFNVLKSLLAFSTGDKKSLEVAFLNILESLVAFFSKNSMKRDLMTKKTKS